MTHRPNYHVRRKESKRFVDQFYTSLGRVTGYPLLCFEQKVRRMMVDKLACVYLNEMCLLAIFFPMI